MGRILGVLAAIFAMVFAGISPAFAAADVQAPGLTSIKRLGPQTVKPGDTVTFEFDVQEKGEEIWPASISFDAPIGRYASADNDLFNKLDYTMKIFVDPNIFPDGEYLASDISIRDEAGNWTYYDSDGPTRNSPAGAKSAAPVDIDWDQLSFTVDSDHKTPVTPGAVTFQDLDGTSKDTYTIPSVEGVEYRVNGAAKTVGTHTAAGDITVTARAKTGYVLKDGSTSSWSHSFSSYAPPKQVTPAAPVFTDEDGTEDDTYTIPSTTGVEYLVDGKAKVAATYSGTGKITVTARAKAGYALQGGSTSSWSQTFSDETAEYTAPTKSPFVDVSTGQQFYKEMSWLAESGISTGWKTSTGQEYRPLTRINRDAMAAFLYRMAGSPEYTAPAKSPFVDVSADQQFYKEMAWLSEQGISTGWQGSKGREYRPLTPINRDAMAAFLYRMEGSPAYTAPSASPFADVSTGQQFYKEMAWMAEEGISTGWTSGGGTRTYRPLSPINRDAMAAFLYRLDALS